MPSRNSLLVCLLCAGFFAAGFFAANLAKHVRVDDQSAYITSSFTGTSAQDNAQGNIQDNIQGNVSHPTITNVVKEVPAYNDEYNNRNLDERPNEYSEKQQGILDSIKQNFVEEAVEILVDNIAVNDLIPLVARISGYAEDHLWQMQQPHDFAKNLLDLNLRECTAEEVLAAQSSHIGEVDFSLAPTGEQFLSADAETAAVSYGSDFEQSNASRIYANFRLPQDYAYNDILVKWCQVSPQQRNIVFGPHSINPSRSINYIWYDARQPEIGDYHVRIYSSDEQPRILAAASYSIIADDDL